MPKRCFSRRRSSTVSFLLRSCARLRAWAAMSPALCIRPYNRRCGNAGDLPELSRKGENMKNYIRILALALFAALALCACGQSDEEKAKAAEAAAAAEAGEPVPLPATNADKAAWQRYLSNVVTRNMQGVKTNSPFM